MNEKNMKVVINGGSLEYVNNYIYLKKTKFTII